MNMVMSLKSKIPARFTLAVCALTASSMGCGGTSSVSEGTLAHATSPLVTAADFANLRTRWVTLLTGGAGLPSDPDYQNKLAAISAHANDLWHGSAAYPAMNTANNRTFLWSDQQLGQTSSAPIQVSYERIRDLTLALKTPGPLHDNPELRSTILSALDWLTNHWYGPTTDKFANWYTWSIGVPLALADTVLMLDLPADQRAQYIAPIDCYIGNPQDDTNGQPPGQPCLASPAGDHTYQHPNGDANRAWEAQIYAAWGALVDSSVLLTLAKNGTNPVLLSETTSGDGFYADGSYIGHSVYAYTGGYGEAYFANVAKILYLLHGSPWTVSDDQQLLKKWALNAFAPLMFQGAAFPTVFGRGVAKQAESDHDHGSWITSDVLLAAELFPSSRAMLRNQAKAWIIGDRLGAYYNNPYTSLFSIALAKQAADSPTPAAASYTQFSAMDRAVAQRENYAFGMNLMSTRIKGPEIINNGVLDDNARGWFQGFGMTFLYTAGERDQYSGPFWATVDPYYLPGTTVEHVTHVTPPIGQSGAAPSQLPREGGSLAAISNLSNWAGGASNSPYGASGMALFPRWNGSTPRALKSWFAFDNEIFCLGSDIETDGATFMETVVDNRRLNDSASNALTVNGVTKPSSLGWSETMTSVRSIHLQGTGNSGIGYYFPKSQQIVRAQRESRTDCWQSVSTDNPPCSISTVTGNYLKLVIQHNDVPADGTYAYAILPSVTAAQTAAYASNPGVFVLRQDSLAHAVKDNSLGVVMANFWNSTKSGQEDASFNVGSNHPNWLACNAKASVVVIETSDASGDYEEVSVADPTQVNGNPIKITMQMFATSIVTSDPRISVTMNTRPTIITIDPSGSKGTSLKVKFKMHY